MPRIIIDPESSSLKERYAVIRTPRRSRQRFAEAIVRIVDSKQQALDEADAQKKCLPAIVYGPSVSSECQRIYYLVCWLDE
ncbi:MAG: hypothetical protein KZQ58_05220 [gamma proteobacterium symbiont of Bathyaustriella thionipta]|nr:hypothetical protein [gamma proteobacterium symbiont of Bathyaustriella thionipta]